MSQKLTDLTKNFHILDGWLLHMWQKGHRHILQDLDNSIVN